VFCQGGWFILKVEERRLAPTPSFSAMREQLRQSLLQDGMIPAATTALTGLKVRRYSLTGQEIEPDHTDQPAKQ